MPNRCARLTSVVLFGLLGCILIAPPVSAQVTSRVEGTVVDEAGNPLEGVEIYLKRADTNAVLKPAKTSKKGTYLYIAEPGEYIFSAKKEGYLAVRQASEIINADGVHSSQSFYFDDKQDFSKKIHLFPAGGLTSKAKNTIDWVLTTPDKHVATVNKLYSESRKGAGEGTGKAGDEGKPGVPAAPASDEKKTVFEEALDHFNDKDYAGAIPLLKQTVEKSPDDPNNSDAYYRLGRSEFETENLVDAEVALKKSKALDPTKPGVSFYIARVYEKKGRKIQAVQALEEEMALSPDSEAVLDALAALYTDTGQVDKAVGLYEGMIAKNPDDFDAYTSLAAIYKDKGDKAKEEEIYTKMGDRDPTGKSLYNLGNLAFNRNEMDKASVYYKKVLDKDPNNAMAHLQFAYTLVNKGDFPGAVTNFEAFLKLSPKDPKAPEAKKMVEDLKKMSPPASKAASKG